MGGLSSNSGGNRYGSVIIGKTYGSPKVEPPTTDLPSTGSVPELNSGGSSSDKLSGAEKILADMRAKGNVETGNSYVSISDRFDGGGPGKYGGPHEGGGALSAGANLVSGAIGRDNLSNTGSVTLNHNTGIDDAKANRTSGGNNKSTSSGGKS
jgi:hypothetical protein